MLEYRRIAGSTGSSPVAGCPGASTGNDDV